jgi:hypothetical protein
MYFLSEQNWSKTPLVSKLKELAERRKLEDLTIGPVLTVSFIVSPSVVNHLMRLYH